MSDIKIQNIEDFDDEDDKELVGYTGYVLQKTYPGYLWGVRLLAKGLIGFTMGELMQFGDAHTMVIHPRDYPTRDSFDKLVIKHGGELLERASLSREGSKNIPVTKRPDGFNARFDETTRQTKFQLKDASGNIITR